MANPDPEIAYDVAVADAADAIMATGRSDFPNQVNNVLGFPFIFRGALDVRATTINEEMKLAATHALAELAREDVPDSVRRTYGVEEMDFGREYIIPKPFDPRVLICAVFGGGESGNGERRGAGTRRSRSVSRSSSSGGSARRTSSCA